MCYTIITKLRKEVINMKLSDIKRAVDSFMSDNGDMEVYGFISPSHQGMPYLIQLSFELGDVTNSISIVSEDTKLPARKLTPPSLGKIIQRRNANGKK